MLDKPNGRLDFFKESKRGCNLTSAIFGSIIKEA